ncbi:MAG: polysulfide reductase NrfD [Chloroflexi bacterium]|nr:polysulfide reductase NrfD [Chloroflexota bacterium]
MIKDRETDLERTVLNPLRQTTMQFWLVIAALGAVFTVGLIALIRQWVLGLGVTGMSRPIYWGVYITNFVFFIGISHAGTLISAILRVTQAEWRRPITRIAEAITFFALILGVTQIFLDLGRSDRILYLFYWGRFQSALLWDVTCVSIYFLSSSLYLFLPLLPDLARLRDRMKPIEGASVTPSLLSGQALSGSAPDDAPRQATSEEPALSLPKGSRVGWRRFFAFTSPQRTVQGHAAQNDTRRNWRYHLYRVMALGWHGSHEQFRRLERGIGIMAILIIPIAVSVHTVVSWIFGMTMQPMWHSTILGPYFVVGAIFSGIAVLFIFMTIVRKAWGLERWIGAKQYNYLGLLLLVMSAFWGYFTLAEYLTTGYGTIIHEQQVIQAKLTGEYAPWFYAMLLCNLILPFAILLRRQGRTPAGTFIASVAIAIGMWIERFTIIAPTLTRPSLGFEKAVYAPTITEALITAAALALFAMLFLLFFKLFPAISIWEVEEGEHVEAVRQKARELMGQGATGQIAASG